MSRANPMRNMDGRVPKPVAEGAGRANMTVLLPNMGYNIRIYYDER